MGCYLSTVDDTVYLTEGEGRNFKWATASCQGWRREQEDAEVCITDFDEDASLFVLCDGHGGAEVAKYTVAHLPDFLKNHKLYKAGDYKKALEQAFIDFDALLRTDEVMSELKKLAFDEEETKEEEKEEEKSASKTEVKDEPQAEAQAGPSASGSGAGSGSSSGYQTASTSGSGPSKSNGASSIAEDVDTDTLRREAQVPIAELMLKYAENLPKSRVQSLRHSALGASPVIRNKEAGDEQEPKAGGSGSNDDPEPSSSKSTADEGPSSPSAKFPLQSNLDILKKAIEKHFSPEEDDSEDDSEFEASDDSEDDDDSEEDDDGNAESRSDTEDDSDGNEDDGDDEGDAESEGKRCKVLSKKQRKSQKNRGEATSSDEEEGGEEDSDDDEEEGSDGSQSESEGDDEDEDDEEDDGGDLMSGGLLSVAKIRQSLKAGAKVHMPGMDSGCTVVVALVRGGELYVASAGDSRCIVVMRDGKCVPMSFDHKPENHIELTRITRAGGFVSEGRVNGGLNLSRAFGDFTYKNPKRPAPEQMITPCPDVKTTPINSKEVEYIFLACDGIWNSMKNNQVAMFIRRTEPRVNDLSDVCAALFKECLAPTTDGDGTGCDNMTCILVKYDNPNEEESSTNKHTDLKSTTTSDENKKEKEEANGNKGESCSKRQAEIEPEDSGHYSKRRCLRLLESEVLMRELPQGSPSSMATNLTSEQSQE